MNLILQVNDDTAHAVALGDNPSCTDLDKALSLLANKAGIQPDLIRMAKMIGQAMPYQGDQ